MSLARLSLIVPTALLAFALGLERLEERLLGPDAGTEAKGDNRRACACREPCHRR